MLSVTLTWFTVYQQSSCLHTCELQVKTWLINVWVLWFLQSNTVWPGHEGLGLCLNCQIVVVTKWQVTGGKEDTIVCVIKKVIWKHNKYIVCPKKYIFFVYSNRQNNNNHYNHHVEGPLQNYAVIMDHEKVLYLLMHFHAQSVFYAPWFHYC